MWGLLLQTLSEKRGRESGKREKRNELLNFFLDTYYIYGRKLEEKGWRERKRELICVYVCL